MVPPEPPIVVVPNTPVKTTESPFQFNPPESNVAAVVYVTVAVFAVIVRLEALEAFQAEPNPDKVMLEDPNVRVLVPVKLRLTWLAVMV